MNADYLHRMHLRMKGRYNIVGECYEFTGVKNNKGYGLISYNIVAGKRTTMAAHRFIYWQSNPGVDIEGLVVMHKCDNPSCIRLEHLQIGTQSDNAKDKWSKGRANYNPAQRKSKRIRKLTDEQVVRIRSTQAPIKLIATIFNVSEGHVSQIRNGRRKQLVR